MKFGVNTFIWSATFDQSHFDLLPTIKEAGFDGVELGFSPKIFIPIMMQAQIIVGNPEDMLKERRNRWVNAFGRLKPGVSQQQDG